MIDLNYTPKRQPKRAEPEEIAVAVIAIVIWTIIIFGIMGGL